MRTLFVSLVLCLLLPLQAWSMTGREFMDLPTARERLAEAEHQRGFFASRGYQAVPEAYALTARAESLIIDNQWQDKWMDWIALRAAMDLGMHR